MSLGLLLLLAASGRAAAADADIAAPPPIWITDASGARFRVRFDPGERLILAAGAETLAGDLAGLRAAPGFAVEFGLLLRGERPAPGWDVHWKRNHEIAHLRLHPAAGTRRRRRRRRAVPRALPAPVARGDADVAGDAAVSRCRCRSTSACWSRSGTCTARCGPRRAARRSTPASSRRGARRFLALAPAGALAHARRRRPLRGRPAARRRGRAARDHRVSPMSTLALALHSERADGLAAGGVRAEASHRWSSVRGWERAYRVDADVEVTPLAANDRPAGAVRDRDRRRRPRTCRAPSCA